MRRGFEAGILGFGVGVSIHILAHMGTVTLMLQLLARGAHVDTRDSERNTPLLLAARHGDAQMAEMLLAQGAGVNAKSHAEETPLLCAARLGHVRVANLLLDNHADTSVNDKDGSSVLSVAITLETLTYLSC
ncbi:hypothetical protein AJ79_10314 [Helicocarpus griseus UAMH5409]|uniref:Uncharacterized protein n=1 Tax=Helicocarpus griseus UAMH5409 TaxID=1447875 RepID=A0A2B7WEM5_9EURO|nr:hypothetical protein AJ79_10314 [Helicocarpus griseus UAMH5409]